MKHTIVWSVLSLLLTLTTACSMRDFSEDNLIEVNEKRLADPGLLELGPVSLPSEDGYSFAVSREHAEIHGASGADCDEQGSAELNAALSGEGTAWGEFELGHIFPAGRTRDMTARISFSFEYSYEVSRPEAIRDDHGVDGRMALKLIVLDSAQELVIRDVILDESPLLSAQSGSSTTQNIVEFAMAADRAYHVKLVGRVELEAKPDSTLDDQNAIRCSVSAKNLKMKVVASETNGA